MTRREFLATVGVTIGAAGVMVACNTSSAAPPDQSPFYPGKFGIRTAILGRTPQTTAMPLPSDFDADTRARLTSNTGVCGGPSPTSFTYSPPALVPASVYYPAHSGSTSVDVPIEHLPVGPLPGGRFPVVLYAHARRVPVCPTTPTFSGVTDPSLFDITQDYTRVGYVLRHLASHGCVVVAPDLSWLGGIVDGGDSLQTSSASTLRSRVLVAYYQYLQTLNASHFSNQLDLSHVLLVGHSTGGSACLFARGDLVAAGGPEPVAIGLLAPATTPFGASLAARARTVLIFEGTRDFDQQANPEDVYQQAGIPKALVKIPGANHFGYTDICSPDNKLCVANDPPGAIIRLAQQITAAAYLSALMRRYALNDTAMQVYLSGQRIIEGLDTFGATGITITQNGM